MKEEEHLELDGVKRNGNENVFARPNGLRENAETAIPCRGPGPARKKRYANNREEELAQMCPCGKAVESRTHIVGECEINKEERDVLEMRKVDECDMEKFGTLDSSEKAIAILGDRWWPQKVKQHGDKISKKFGFYVTYGENVMSAQIL